MKNNRFALGVTAAAILLLAALCVEMLLPVWRTKEKQGDVEAQSGLYLNGTYSSFCPEETYIVRDTQDAMETAAELFGLEGDPQEVLAEAAVVENGGQCYYRFSQTYQGLPVLGRTVTLAVDQDEIVFLAAGNYAPAEPETLTPQVTLETALAQAEQYVTGTLGSGPVEGLELTGLEEGNLCIYNLDQETDARLAYDCRLTYGSASGGASFNAVIDAVTGEILSLTDNVLVGYSYGYEFTEILSEKIYPLDLEQYGERYVFRDTARNMELYSCGNDYLTYENPNNIVYNSDNQFGVNDASLFASEKAGETNLDAELSVYECTIENGKWVRKDKEEGKAILLLSSVQQTYEFYREILNRKGFNGKNGTMLLVSDRHADEELSGSDNACALTLPNLSIMLFNSKAMVGNIALPAHEFTHAVEQTISTMEYKGESGCLMEGYSDLMGQLVLAHTSGQDPDWKLYGRDMSTPQQGEQVYYYGDLTPDTEVHRGSTVVSHCGYQIWQSWRESGMDVPTCAENMARLLYRCLFLLPSRATLTDWRWAMEQVAIQMIEDEDLTSQHFDQMISAFQESGIPSMMEQEQVQTWMAALTEIASMPIKNGTDKLTEEQMELAACSLFPMAAAELSDMIGGESYKVDSNMLYTAERNLIYVLYGLFGEAYGDAILAKPAHFTYLPDLDNSNEYDYQAAYEEPQAIKAGWTMEEKSSMVVAEGMIIYLKVVLTEPDGQAHEMWIVLERGKYPGVFFNGYSIINVSVIQDSDEPSAEPQSPEEPERTREEVLQEQLELLTGQYGVISLGKEVYPEVTGYGGGEELVDPARLTGLLGADIFDYDGDGQEELLTVRLETEAGSDEGWGEAQCFLTVYEWDGAAEQAVPVGEKSFRFNALTNSLTQSAIHLARGTFDNGETGLYLTYSWEMNDCVFGVLRISYQGALEVTGGVECHDFHGAFYCYDAVGSGAMDALCQSGFVDSDGWMPLEVYEFEGSAPDQSRIEHYRSCYMEELEDIGLIEPGLPGQWMNPDRPTGNDLETIIQASQFDRASIVRKPADRYIVSNGQLTNLCGLWHLSSTALLEEDMTLSVYDEGELLTPWR